MNNQSLFATLLLATAAGTAAAQPVFTQLPAANSIQCIGLFVSEDGQVVSGFVGGNTSFIWRAAGVPQIETVTGGGSSTSSGPLGSVDGMDGSGTRFLFGYRDATLAPDSIYTGGLAIPSVYENGTFTVIAPPPIALKCDQSLVTPTAMSGDGNTVMAMPWNHCRVAPYAWTAANGWVAWATQDTFPPFGETGYESHKVTCVSRNGAAGAGWYQSGNGYSGRTALVWTNNGATVSRLDTEPHSVLWGQADAISGNGRYVAGAGVPDSLLPPEENQDSNKYLYRWSAETGVQVLPGKVDTYPAGNRHPNVAGISNNGKIIVGQDSFGFDREAFIWTPTGGGQKLTDYLVAHGLDLAAQFVNLTSAAGMSPDGRYITGQWADFGGSVGPYVLDLGPQACSDADMGSQGGVAVPDYRLDNNDFVVFIDKFFNGDAQADMGVQGGIPGHDGNFDNNDFIVFIDIFFAGC